MPRHKEFRKLKKKMEKRLGHLGPQPISPIPAEKYIQGYNQGTRDLMRDLVRQYWMGPEPEWMRGEDEISNSR